MKTIIIGGVAGGASAAARLRRLDEHAEIILLERGAYVSFASCGLPYYVGGEIADERKLTVQTPQSLRARFAIDVRIRSEAIAISRSAKTVTIRNLSTGLSYTEAYDHLILSPGAAPIVPPLGIAEGSERVFTLRTVPDSLRMKAFLDKQKPRSAVIVGGGYIGLETAENLARAGVAVTIVELAEHILPPLDLDTAVEVQSYARAMGIALRLGTAVKAVAEDERGLTVTLSDGTIAADMLVLAAGVKPDTALARDAGLAMNERGAILVDRHMRTSDNAIFAVGDAAEVWEFLTNEPAFLPLAGPANKQGRIAADNIAGFSTEYTGTQGSSILRVFDMTVAATGINERAAKAAGLAYDKTYLFAGSHAAYYPGATNMAIKALWEKGSLRLLGAQLVGFDGVDKRADVLATAIRFGAKATDLARLELCYAPPFGSAKDPVNMLGFIAENVETGKVRQFFWHDVASLPRDGSVTLLDVRTPAETERGMIPGFTAIPLDSLRERLGELPAGRTVYVHCQSGLRSYIACRILAGYGYDCYNLAGGYRLWNAVTSELNR